MRVLRNDYYLIGHTFITGSKDRSSLDSIFQYAVHLKMAPQESAAQ